MRLERCSSCGLMPTPSRFTTDDMANIDLLVEGDGDAPPIAALTDQKLWRLPSLTCGESHQDKELPQVRGFPEHPSDQLSGSPFRTLRRCARTCGSFPSRRRCLGTRPAALVHVGGSGRADIVQG